MTRISNTPDDLRLFTSTKQRVTIKDAPKLISGPRAVGVLRTMKNEQFDIFARHPQEIQSVAVTGGVAFVLPFKSSIHSLRPEVALGIVEDISKVGTLHLSKNEQNRPVYTMSESRVTDGNVNFLHLYGNCLSSVRRYDASMTRTAVSKTPQLSRSIAWGTTIAQTAVSRTPQLSRPIAWGTTSASTTPQLSRSIALGTTSAQTAVSATPNLSRSIAWGTTIAQTAVSRTPQLSIPIAAEGLELIADKPAAFAVLLHNPTVWSPLVDGAYYLITQGSHMVRIQFRRKGVCTLPTRGNTRVCAPAQKTYRATCGYLSFLSGFAIYEKHMRTGSQSMKVCTDDPTFRGIWQIRKT